ncbi:MAG: AMP-binding protein [Deltaproteobacteria bacterium]|nr:AMP-binding protein [Deltaproteobacteria bacterium]
MGYIDTITDIVRKLGRAAVWLVKLQIKDRALGRTALSKGSSEGLIRPAERSFSDLLEQKARERNDNRFLRFYERAFSLRDINQQSNRVAHRLKSYGAGPGQTAAIMMENSPEWLIVFYATQKLGMCAVPVPTGITGDDLSSILLDTETRFLFIDHRLLAAVETVQDKVNSIDRFIVNTIDADPRFKLPSWAEPLEHYLDVDLLSTNLGIEFDRNNPCLIMYTSGTTGLPKGVVYTYAHSGVLLLGIAAHVFYEKDDVLYTCLPLYHANALFFTVTEAMWRDLQVGLSRGFSARNFWGEIRMYGATTFNALGSMIPVLAKQPRKPNDRENSVRMVLAAGCPAAIWREFEERFAVKVYDVYDAVDTGSFASFNMGNGPLGSFGKPTMVRFRIVDEKAEEVRPGERGELITWVGKKKGVLAYYKSEKETEANVRDGWLYTGDFVYKDENGFLFYCGRTSETVRRSGERIGVYELERELEKHPDILECAAYPVANGTGEDDLMISIVPLEGRKPEASALYQWITERVPANLIPRYIDFVEALPKTGTYRVIKRRLIEKGVTETAVDFQKSDTHSALDRTTL